MKARKYLTRWPLILIICSSFVNMVHAQQVIVDSTLLDRVAELEKQAAYKKPGEEHFLMAGLATFGFVNNKTTTSANGINLVNKSNSMADADHFEFSPMLLWRHGKKVLMEFEPSFDGVGVGVNWAAISYFAAPGLIIRGGYFVLPFGTYSKRLAAGWIDKLPTDPSGLADLPPGSDFGVEIEGGLPMGDTKWNYDLSVTNGMQLLPDGTIQGAGVVDNNRNKTITGRIGFLPFSNSSLEIGLSGMFGKVGDQNSPLENARTKMFALDLNYVKSFNPILVNLKAQYNYININKQEYMNPDDQSIYTFDNTTHTGFAQLSLRPTGAESKFVKSLEAAFRIGNFNTPVSSLWGQKSTMVEAGLLYWLNWRTVVKFGYSANKITSATLTDNATITKSNSLFLQFAIQL